MKKTLALIFAILMLFAIIIGDAQALEAYDMAVRGECDIKVSNYGKTRGNMFDGKNMTMWITENSFFVKVKHRRKSLPRA